MEVLIVSRFLIQGKSHNWIGLPEPGYITNRAQSFSILIARFDFPSVELKEMESVGGSGSNEVENDLEMKLLRDRFRLSAISIAESEGSIHFNPSFSLFFNWTFNFLILLSNSQLTKAAWKFQKLLSLALLI